MNCGRSILLPLLDFANDLPRRPAFSPTHLRCAVCGKKNLYDYEDLLPFPGCSDPDGIRLRRSGATDDNAAEREIEMSSHIRSRRECVVAKVAVRNLRRTIRDLRERLLVETNPIDYYSALADAATAEAQLDDFCVQIGEWELRRAGVVPHGVHRT